MKLGYQLIREDSKLWVQVLRAKYGWEAVVPDTLKRYNCSRLWAGIARVWDDVKKGLIWEVRDGRSMDFWRDQWVDNVGCLGDYLLHDIRPTFCKVAAFVTDAGDWDMEALRLVLSDVIVDHVLAIMPPREGNGSDTIGSNCGTLGYP
ncbi:hypothetical protein V6N13_111143 [Hibiscus sabdariffa]